MKLAKLHHILSSLFCDAFFVCSGHSRPDFTQGVALNLFGKQEVSMDVPSSSCHSPTILGIGIEVLSAKKRMLRDSKLGGSIDRSFRIRFEPKDHTPRLLTL